MTISCISSGIPNGEYDVIVIEALNLKGLASGFLAKSFHDVAIEASAAT
ncbi:MAG: hypothetical protein R2880_19305 [Deinococcales bacterium]